MKYYILLLFAPLVFFTSCGDTEDDKQQGEAVIPVADEVQETGALNAATIGMALAGALKENNFDSLNNYILSASEIELYYNETDLHKDEYDERYYEHTAATIRDSLRQQFEKVHQQLRQKNITLAVPSEDKITIARMDLTRKIKGLRVDIPLQGNDSLNLSCQCIKVINNYYIFDNIALLPAKK